MWVNVENSFFLRNDGHFDCGKRLITSMKCRFFLSKEQDIGKLIDMKRIRRSDYYAVSKTAYFSYMDVRFLLDLYLPLIGSDALTCYLRLQEWRKRGSGSVDTFETLLTGMKLSAGEFENALRALEAVGLIRTFASEGSDSSYFVFVVNAPLPPDLFVKDPLLYGTLIKYIGEEGLKTIEARYANDNAKTDGMEECSESFSSFFSPDLGQGYYAAEEPSVKGKRNPTVKTDFDYGRFESYMKEQGENLSWFSKEDIAYIAKLSTLFGFDEATCGSLAIECFRYERNSKVFDREKFAKECENGASFAYFHQEKGEKSQVSGDTRRAKAIRLMDTTAPSNYLSLVSGGHAAAPSELKLLQRLALSYGLPDPVINALVTYCLEKCDNRLIASYVEKVAASLQRAGCKTARDAMEFLLSGNRGGKKKTQTPKEKTVKETDEGKKSQQPVKEEKEDDFDRMMEELRLYEERNGH